VEEQNSFPCFNAKFSSLLVLGQLPQSRTGISKQAHGPNPASKAISSRLQKHFVHNDKITSSRTFIDLVECNIPRNNRFT